MAGLWELPWLEEVEGTNPEAGLERRYGGRWKVGSEKGRVRHSVTNRLFDISVVEASLGSNEEVKDGPEAGWFLRSELTAIPVTGLVGKALDLFDD